MAAVYPAEVACLTGATMPESIMPFLKWPGGKRWAAAYLASIIREKLKGIYVEPFLGGAAVFFHLRPSHAILSDINADLISTYEVVRRSPDALLAALRTFQVSKRNYYRTRTDIPSTPILRAARFLYLNRTAFGGMYRLNRRGEFNVPYGGGERTPGILLKTPLLRDASMALKNVELREVDFENVINATRRDDVVYCDPTYTVTHDQNGFVRYNEQNFSWADQERLAKVASRARSRGVTVLISNAHHKEIRKIYRFAALRTLTRHSTLSTDPLKRRTVREYLIIL
jgi:DNA adenine methylase